MQSKLILLGLLCCLTFSGLSQTDLEQQINIVLGKVDQLMDEESYDEALKIIEKALVENQQALLQQPLLKADLLQKRGIVYYWMDEAHYQEAISEYDAALKIRNTKLSFQDSIIIHNNYLIMVSSYESGEFKKGIASGKEAVRGLRKTTKEYPEKKARVYFELGDLYLSVNDFSNAQDHLRQSLQLFKQLKNKEEILRCYNSLAGALAGLGEKREAINYYQKIIETKEASQEHLANAYNNLGKTFWELKRVDQALLYFQKAEQLNRLIYEETHYADIHENLAENLENIGICYKELGRYEDAKKSSLAAMKIYQEEFKTKFHPDIAKCHDNMGDIHRAQANYQAALKSYQKGMSCIVFGFRQNNVFVNPDLSQMTCEDNATLLTLLASKAKSFSLIYQKDTSQKKYIEAAYATYSCFDSLLTEVRQGFRARGSIYKLLEKNLPHYEGAIQTALSLYELTNDKTYFVSAYHFAAKNKAIVLLDGLQSEQAKFEGLPDELGQKEKILKTKLMALEADFFSKKSAPNTTQNDLAELQEQRFQTKLAYEELIAEFEEKFPKYYQLKYAFTKTLGISYFQDKLPKDGLLLEYFVGTEKLFLFAISQTKFYFFELEKPINFKADCIRFRETISNVKLENDPKLAYALFQVLLENPLQEIEQNQTVNRLFIIPDDVLLQISFDALLTEKTSVWRNNQNPYLLKKYAISYAYTNQLLFDKKKKSALKANLELFGGFGLDYKDVIAIKNLKLERGDSTRGKRSLGALVNVIDEVSEIANLLGGKYWLNEEVSKKHFLENAARFKILHWAGHGWIREHDPMNSALVFSLNSNVRDSLLRVSELYALKLNAEMVVLSACNTAYGKLYKGEGMSSLSRAFAYAGCPTVVSSLWNASDISTKEVLVDFYKNLKKSHTKDRALQQAKLNFIKHNSPINADPALWSNMVVIGDSSAFNMEKENSYYLFYLLGSLVFLGTILFWRKRKTDL